MRSKEREKIIEIIKNSKWELENSNKIKTYSNNKIGTMIIFERQAECFKMVFIEAYVTIAFKIIKDEEIEHSLNEIFKNIVDNQIMKFLEEF